LYLVSSTSSYIFFPDFMETSYSEEFPPAIMAIFFILNSSFITQQKYKKENRR